MNTRTYKDDKCSICGLPEEPQLHINKVKCLKCGDIIESKTYHDFVTCKCGNISVNGGNEYKRRAGNVSEGSYEELDS